MITFKTIKDKDSKLDSILRDIKAGSLDKYEIMDVAGMFGWSDPGYIEPLVVTVARAAQFLKSEQSC